MAYGYGYGGYPGPGGYYAPPMPDQLAQLRGAGQYQPQVMGQNATPGNIQMQNIPMQTVSGPINAANVNSTILWVSGEREAVEYPVAPNSAVALWDSSNPVVYLKKADASGKPDTEIYDLVKRTPVQAVQTPVQATQAQTVEYVPRADFDALTARFDAIANELEALKNKSSKCISTKKTKEAAPDE